MREILLLCEYPTLNGGERSMLSTLDAVRVGGFVPVMMAPPEGPLANELIARGVEMVPFRCRGDGGQRLPLGRLREALAGILRSRRPALLHANSLAMGRLSGPVAAQLRVPSLSHLRDIVKLSAQAVADLNCHRRLLAVSNATHTFHTAGGLSAEKTHVVYNGVDLEQFQPHPPTGYLHQELGLPPDAQLIGSIGQIGLRKGQDVLLRAAVLVAGRSSQPHWLIIGERHSQKVESRQFEHDLLNAVRGPLAGRVHFLSRRDDIPRLLNELTLLAHAARQEPLGRVLLEAAAAGVAIVATGVGGTPEIFPPEADAARLVPADDAAALAEATLELLGDDTLCRRLAETARRRATDQFDIRMAGNNLLKHYLAIAD